MMGNNVLHEPHISLRGLCKYFEDGCVKTPAFENLTLSVNEGEFVAILGPSGCGKSTLLRIIAGLESSSIGELSFSGLKVGTGNTGSLDKNIAMVFQEHGLFPWLTLSGNISFILENNVAIPKSKVADITQKYLAIVGLTDYADFYPHQASGGMKQRVSIARSFANNPDILLMDEPFVFLDFQSRLLIHELLLTIWQENKKTILFVTHDIEEAVILADRIIVLSAHPGRIIADEANDFERPRDMLSIRKTPEFSAKVDHLISLIRQDIVL